jgi:hypothetical protein
VELAASREVDSEAGRSRAIPSANGRMKSPRQKLKSNETRLAGKKGRTSNKSIL